MDKEKKGSLLPYEGIIEFLIGIGVAVILAGVIYFYIWPLLVGEGERRTIFDALQDNLGRMRDGDTLRVLGVMPDELGVIVGFSVDNDLMDLGPGSMSRVGITSGGHTWSDLCEGVPLANKLKKPCSGGCLCYCSGPLDGVSEVGDQVLEKWCIGNLECVPMPYEFKGGSGEKCTAAIFSSAKPYRLSVGVDDVYVGVTLKREGNIISILPPPQK